MIDPAEAQSLAELFVRSSIRRPTDTLGVRRTDISFTDVQEAAAGVFLLYPQTPFYVLFLAAQRLQELIAAEATQIETLLRLVQATGRTVNPIKDLTPLSNITSALFELETAIGQRTEAFKNIEEVPAFKRFDTNIQRFLEIAGKNVKEGTEIIETPQEARSLMTNALNDLREIHEELVRRVRLITVGMDNFSLVNLPSLAAQGVISRSRQVIQSRTQSLQNASETERLVQNRDTVLELLASRAVVRQYGSFRVPDSVFPGEITALPYSDVTHLGVEGGVVGTALQHNVQRGFDVLDYFLDAPVSPKISTSVDIVKQGIYGATFTAGGGGFVTAGVQAGDVVYVRSGTNIHSRWVVTSFSDSVLTASGSIEVVAQNGQSIEVFRAPDESMQALNPLPVSIDGLATEPFIFNRSAPTLVPDNYILYFEVNGNPVAITVNTTPASIFTVSWSGYHPGQLADFLTFETDTALSGSEKVRWECYFTPVFDGEVSITSLGGNNYRATLVSGDLNSANVLDTGYYVKILTGSEANTTRKIFAVDATLPKTFVDFDNLAPLASLQNMRIQIGTKPKLRLTYHNQSDAVAFKKTLRITGGTASAAPTIGMAEGRNVQGAPVFSRVMMNDVNVKGIRVGGETSFDEITTSHARTDPFSPNTVTLYKATTTGDLSVVGPDVSVVLSDQAVLDQIGIGDWLVFRNSNPTNTQAQVTDVTGNTVTATLFSSPPSDQLGVTLDVGDVAIPFTTSPYTIIIDEGPNGGTYEVLGKTTSVLDFALAQLLPTRQDALNDPLEMDVRLGFNYPRFFSLSEEVSSSVVVAGSAARQFFSTPVSARGIGKTTWLQLSAVPTGLQAGDLFQVYATDYKTPSQEFEILSVDFDNRLIELDGLVDNDASYNISQNIPPPFALLKVAQVVSTDALEEALTVWLDRSVNQDSYWTDLNRFINPLLVNENPTAVQVADATNRILDLYGYLNAEGAALAVIDPALTVEAILNTYTVEPQPTIDTLIRSFIEKGADKAVDILLEGNFTGFFGLDVDSSSYAGDMMKQMRELSREDLPIRKVDRLETQQGQSLGSAEDEDFEFSGSDVEGSTGIPIG